MRVETRQRLESEKTRVNAQKPQLKSTFKNSISGKNPTKSAVPSGTMSLLDKEKRVDAEVVL